MNFTVSGSDICDGERSAKLLEKLRYARQLSAFRAYCSCFEARSGYKQVHPSVQESPARKFGPARSFCRGQSGKSHLSR